MEDDEKKKQKKKKTKKKTNDIAERLPLFSAAAHTADPFHQPILQ